MAKMIGNIYGKTFWIVLIKNHFSEYLVLCYKLYTMKQYTITLLAKGKILDFTLWNVCAIN